MLLKELTTFNRLYMFLKKAGIKSINKCLNKREKKKR